LATSDGTLQQTSAPPRSAAVAGVLFSILMGVALVITRSAVPAYQTDNGEWLRDSARLNSVRFAVQLVPFAGIAFLWFIGVLRHRIGVLEDRFFASVFLGSGLLFVATLFASAALSGALVETVAGRHMKVLESDMFFLMRHLVGAYLNVFAIKMAGVFIMSTSMIVLRTAILPRWLAFLGFACAAVLLLVVSTCILFTEFRPPRHADLA